MNYSVAVDEQAGNVAADDSVNLSSSLYAYLARERVTSRFAVTYVYLFIN